MEITKICPKCNKEMVKLNNGTFFCTYCESNWAYMSSNCDIPMPQGFGEQKGWICPVCGRGVAPWVDVCPCQSDCKITYGTAISLKNDVDSQSTVTSIDSEWNKYRTYTESKE